MKENKKCLNHKEQGLNTFRRNQWKLIRLKNSLIKQYIRLKKSQVNKLT